MKKKELETNIVFLLDRSGSMNGMEDDTIGGYNSYIDSNRNNSNTTITTILFDDMYEILNVNTPIKDVKKLTRKEYYVRGSTALLDAIGRTINNLDKLKKEKVIFIITTDGYENASREYSKKDIKKLINEHDNWCFIYLGADIDSYSEGESIGIKQSNIANYEKTSSGIGKLYKAMEYVTSMFNDDMELDESWKEELK